MTLEGIREQLPKSAWRHNGLFETIGVAVKMGVRPSAFWAMSEQDKAYLIAYHRATSTMQEYEHYLADKEAHRKKPKSKSS